MKYKGEEKKFRKVNFGKIPEIMEIPDLVEIQKESYNQFLQKNVPLNRKNNIGLQAIFLESFPITDLNERGAIEFVDYKILEPRHGPRECLERGISYSAPIKIKVRFRNKRTGVLKEEEIFLGDFPCMTEQGTFIINGVERTIVSQFHRAPGVFYAVEVHPGGERQYSARIIPYWGSWIEFNLEPNNIMYISFDRKRKIPATVLLKALGYSEEKILRLFSSLKEISIRVGTPTN